MKLERERKIKTKTRVHVDTRWGAKLDLLIENVASAVLTPASLLSAPLPGSAPSLRCLAPLPRSAASSPPARTSEPLPASAKSRRVYWNYAGVASSWALGVFPLRSLCQKMHSRGQTKIISWWCKEGSAESELTRSAAIRLCNFFSNFFIFSICNRMLFYKVNILCS